ncbi:MAG: hypothetical protein K8R89_09455 [Anaerolineae bacterium]|nr:hypothetical protein [Anaerolineae bacterium]
MAAVTTSQLLHELRQACNQSSPVSHIEERLIDADILSVRVHLTIAHIFINAFYNVTTGKTAFALVRENQRLYGVDNAKMDWHRHPFDDPTRHVPCAPIRFTDFLTEVEAHYSRKEHL